MHKVTNQIGNTKITVHGMVIAMSPEEQAAHFKKLQQRGDPAMQRLAGIMLKHFQQGGGQASAERESA